MEAWEAKWDDLEDVDKFVVAASATLTLGGAIAALVSGKPAIFVAGAGMSVAIVGARWVTRDDSDPAPPVPPAPPVTSAPPRRAEDYTYGGGGLGAPIGRMEDKGPVRTFNGLPTVGEAKNFPLMHRVPDADIRTEPLDDRIRWATSGPLGPYTGQTVTGFW